ncbi:hypothetical protein [Janthinobacterium fluminis]|uniref:Uncharacterized protein n=1 Tax=Janthinobacterium fluminis TaxID=2987524 RepID=A0ABT5K2A1_9BURK|nr:hypothetical protein [Janthinobacterium fluminis]MDC8758856.1 hypothetical protein [Janthinobacterium fluminis]
MISIKKALFIFCAAVGLSGAIAGFAVARPSQQTCDNLEIKCQQGNPRACELLARHCP